MLFIGLNELKPSENYIKVKVLIAIGEANMQPQTKPQTIKFDIPTFYFVAGEVTEIILDFEIMENTIRGDEQ